MVWLAKRLAAFSVLLVLSFFVAAALTGLNAPPLLVVATPLVIPLVLTWPTANRWRDKPTIGPLPTSRARTPRLLLLLIAAGLLGLLVSISLWQVSAALAVGAVLGTGIGIERIYRASRPRNAG